MKLSVIIPAHNEEDHIIGVVAELRNALLGEKIDFEIIVVNDNSKDRTASLANDLTKQYSDVRAIHRTGKNGFGRAIREGLAHAVGDSAILVMADKSDDPKDVVKIFRKLEEGYDVAYGSRFMEGSSVSNYPPFKLIVNRLANYFIMSIFFLDENDITNAFKGYNMKVIRAIRPLKSDHFNITAELPLKAYACGFTKIAVPVNWYGRGSGVSKLSIMRMGHKYLQTVLEIWFGWIAGSIKTRAQARERARHRDTHWEEYWQKNEDSNFLGKILFKFREKVWVKTFVRFAAEKSKLGRILEVGSGAALSSILLSKNGAGDITALDISTGALRKARASAKRSNVHMHLVRGDMHALPFTDNAFDLVWNSGTVEHFEDPVPILKEMKRVGSEVICIVPAESFIFAMLSKVTGIFGTGFKSYFIREDETFYSEESFLAVLKETGFKEIDVKTVHCAGLFPYVAAYCKR